MANHVIKQVVGIEKFMGSLVGALLGDCLGAPFEGLEEPNISRVQKYFDDMEKPSSVKPPVKKFTDDTAMTLGILESILALGFFDAYDLASRFKKNYFQDPNRGYGESVITVFKKLKQSFERVRCHMVEEVDIWKPAQEQFNGSGSLGNGGAMRVSPVALYRYSNYTLMLSTAEKCTRLTHTHKLGINGALLQVIAIHQALFEDPNQPLNVDRFINEIIDKMIEIEKDEEDPDNVMPYVNQLKKVKSLLMEEEVDDEVVIHTLGTSIEALYSVPTAIYCFLRSQRQITSIKTENKFRRTLQYCILLGGDTDTIASMAGAISGAYQGFEYIDKCLQSHCEGVGDIIEYAERLHNITPKPTINKK